MAKTRKVQEMANKKSRKSTPAKRASIKRGAAAAPGAVLAAPQVTVVNMIPRALSGEQGQDSEPMLTINPANRRHIVGTAFTRDPMGGNTAPIYISTDAGRSWQLNSIVPSGGPMTGDITVAFSGTGSKLYSGILRTDTPQPGITRMATLRTEDFSATTEMTILEDRLQPDQPFVQAATVDGGADRGLERVYVGNNDFAGQQKTATLDVMLDAGANNPALKKVRLEKRTTLGQDGPQVRPAIHANGTVYAIYYSWKSGVGNFTANTFRITSTDVVVVRDDDWGNGNSPFEDLKDPNDNVSGIRVVRNVSFAFNRNGKPQNGQQRLGGNLSIAVDPRLNMSSNVYIAWNDEPTRGDFTAHVRRSTNRGETWSSADLLTLSKATNAALAINRSGVIGLLYQQLTGVGVNRRWQTHFRRSIDGNNWLDIILADTPANTPSAQFDPYLGDYSHLVADQDDFCGIFSANNVPNLQNFPNGVTYQRTHDFGTRKLLALDNFTEVGPSIDPFFFRIS